MRMLCIASVICLVALTGCSSSSSSSKPPPPKSGIAPPEKGGAATASAKKFKESSNKIEKKAKKAASPDAPWDAEVVLDNKTDMSLDLYVDGAMKGAAGPGSSYSTTVSAGSHTLMAKSSDGQSVSRTESFLAGDLLTWTISLEPAP